MLSILYKKLYYKYNKKIFLKKNLFFWTFIITNALLFLILGLGIGAWLWINQDLPHIEKLSDYRPPIISQVFTHDGQLMGEITHERRYITQLDEIPHHVIMAFVAAEDGDFFKHPGIDISGILRAAIANFKAGKVVQGGSTITQQVAKTLLLSPQRTYTRKIKEIILAWEIERHLNKNEILFLYLNQIYLGHGAYGIQAASLTYFGKSTKDLTIAEGALIAGLVQAPSRYSPLRYPHRARTRQVYVIERMVANRYLTPNNAEAALNQELTLHYHRPTATTSTSYYEETVRQLLEERFGTNTIYKEGLTIITSCDAEISYLAQNAIEKGLNALALRHSYQETTLEITPNESINTSKRLLNENIILERGQIYTGFITSINFKNNSITLRVGSEQGYLYFKDFQQNNKFSISNNTIQKLLKPGHLIQIRADNYNSKNRTWIFSLVQKKTIQAAILIIENATARIRAIIGGHNFSQSQYNRAIQSRRSPGSAFKPFIYAAALDKQENPYTPTSILFDTPVIYEDHTQPDDKWRPKNYDNHYEGAITFRHSLEQSRNIPTIKLLENIGIKYTVKYIRKFGFESELTPTLSLALGASGVSLLELTRGYTVFANQGLLLTPIIIEQIINRDGKIIFQSQPEIHQVISPQTAYIMTNLLKGVIENGTGRGSQISGYALAGKTGTTNDLRDAWFIGYSPQITCGVWVGRDDNEPLGDKETGSRAAGPIWKEIMQKILTKNSPSDFIPPEGIIFIKINKTNNQTLNPSTTNFFEAFKEGTQPNLEVGNNNIDNSNKENTNKILNQNNYIQPFLEQEKILQPN